MTERRDGPEPSAAPRPVRAVPGLRRGWHPAPALVRGAVRVRRTAGAAAGATAGRAEQQESGEEGAEGRHAHRVGSARTKQV